MAGKIRTARFKKSPQLTFQHSAECWNDSRLNLYCLIRTNKIIAFQKYLEQRDQIIKKLEEFFKVPDRVADKIKIIEANKKLIEIMEQKIADVLSEI